MWQYRNPLFGIGSLEDWVCGDAFSSLVVLRPVLGVHDFAVKGRFLQPNLSEEVSAARTEIGFYGDYFFEFSTGVPILNENASKISHMA